LRDPVAKGTAPQFSAVRVIKLAALAEAFGQIEYAFELLDSLAARADVAGTPLAANVRNLIAAAASEYEQFAVPISS
jgi:hypothetical protein